MIYPELGNAEVEDLRDRTVFQAGFEVQVDFEGAKRLAKRSRVESENFPTGTEGLKLFGISTLNLLLKLDRQVVTPIEKSKEEPAI